MNALSQLRADCFHRLRSEELFADALVLDSRPRDEEEAAQIIASIQQALVGISPGPTGKAGLAIVVFCPDGEVPEPDSQGPPLELVIHIRIYENPLVNAGTGGTGIEGEACALDVLNCLHLLNRGGQALYADRRAIREVEDEEERMGGLAWDVVFRQKVSAGRRSRTAQPRINIADGEVTLDRAEDGAAIYYTTDGSAPAPSNAAASLYAVSFAVEAGTTIRAAAFKAGKLGSNIASANW